MSNEALAQLQSFTGKAFTASPSPFMRWLDPVVVSAEEGKLVFRYTIRKEMTNPMGTLHGGISAAIIDDLIGATMFSLGEEYFYTTLNNVIDYFAPAFENDTVTAETTIIKKGSQVVNAQCIIRNAPGTQIIAKGTSNLLKTQKRKGAL